jgi:hypothetical protein
MPVLGVYIESTNDDDEQNDRELHRDHDVRSGLRFADTDVDKSRDYEHDPESRKIGDDRPASDVRRINPRRISIELTTGDRCVRSCTRRAQTFNRSAISKSSLYRVITLRRGSKVHRPVRRHLYAIGLKKPGEVIAP